MALFSTITAGASAAGLDFGSITKPITGLFDNNRGEKRQRRDQLLENLYNAGVSRQALTGVHSDHVRDLENLIRWIQKTGQPAITYINDTKPRGTGADWDEKIIEKFSGWQRMNGSQNLPKNNSGRLPSVAAATKAGGFSGIASNKTVLWMFAALFGAGVFISNYEKWFK